MNKKQIMKLKIFALLSLGLITTNNRCSEVEMKSELGLGSERKFVTRGCIPALTLYFVHVREDKDSKAKIVGDKFFAAEDIEGLCLKNKHGNLVPVYKEDDKLCFPSVRRELLCNSESPKPTDEELKSFDHSRCVYVKVLSFNSQLDRVYTQVREKLKKSKKL